MAAKKKTAAPQAPKAETATQSVVEKRAANARVKTLVTRFASTHARLFNTARAALRKLLPTAQELVYEYRDWIVISYAPTSRGYQGVLVLRADAVGVKLYFNFAKDLSDPAKLLQGSAKQTRYIPLESAVTLKRPEVLSLLQQAIAKSPVPFPATGPGPVILCPTSASKGSSSKS